MSWKTLVRLATFPPPVHPPGGVHPCPVVPPDRIAAKVAIPRSPVNTSAAVAVTGSDVAEASAPADPEASRAWMVAAGVVHSKILPLIVAAVLEQVKVARCDASPYRPGWQFG